MTVIIRRSTDPGALQLTGTVGSLVAILDVVLVAAGWSIALTGTNLRAYQQPATADSALRAYLRIDDSGPGAGGAREARIVGYETMTDVNTGTNPCPTVAQAANGQFVRKSATADGVSRLWLIVADQRTFYMWIATGDLATVYVCWMFGDFYSFKPNDPYRVMMMARSTENSTSVQSTQDEGAVLAIDDAQVMNGHYIFRGVSAAVGAIQASKHGNHSLEFNEFSGVFHALRGVLAYKNPADHYVYTPPIVVTHPSGGNTRRGLMRGMYHFGHIPTNVSDGETIQGQLDLAGKTLTVVKFGQNTVGGQEGVWLIETSNTWPTN